VFHVRIFCTLATLSITCVVPTNNSR
jgi:hypothetical protein